MAAGPFPTVRLIVNADDLGYSAERDEGILACFRCGVVTSASLLVNGASAGSALRLADAVGLPVGLHLNLTEGTPVSPAHTVASLLAPGPPQLPGGIEAPGVGTLASTGKMRGKMGLRAAVAAGQVSMDEVGVEARAQLCRFTELHPRHAMPSHVDGHQHVQVLPGVAHAVAAAMAEARVHATRVPSFGADAAFDIAPASRAAFYREISEQCVAARAVYASFGVCAPAAFVGYSTMGADCTLERAGRVLGDAVRALVDAAAVGADAGDAYAHTVEWMVHPGNQTQPRPRAAAGPPSGVGSAGLPMGTDECGHTEKPSTGDAGCGEGPDDFSMSADREQEMSLLCSPDIALFLRGACPPSQGRAAEAMEASSPSRRSEAQAGDADGTTPAPSAAAEDATAGQACARSSGGVVNGARIRLVSYLTE
jgi:predicted glycoside hydrolase/deacetylase ChbG (UPF0249 family)